MFMAPPKPIVTNPEENSQMLNAQLRELGLYAAHTVGDGNCLFRALSDQLYGTPSHHLKLRQDICDWIEEHKERYAPFVEDDRGLEHHLACMRQQGVCVCVCYRRLPTLNVFRQPHTAAIWSSPLSPT